MSHQIELSDGTILEVRLDGDCVVVGETTVRVEVIDERTVRVHANGRTSVAHVVRDADNVWVALCGQTHVFPRPDRARPRRRTGAGEGNQTVSPPMPGQVIKIEVAVGDIVEKGQTVAVVSAMKMETPLKAPYAGEVTAVHTEVGTQVNPGDVLVDIAKAE